MDTSKRDAVATKERILKAGLAEFGLKGTGGARMDKIALRAKCNIRMLYHYFNGKEGLYLACLARVYNDIRAKEKGLNLDGFEPVEAIKRLVKFTFDHMLNNPDFVRMVAVENTESGKYLKKLTILHGDANSLIDRVSDVLKRGLAKGLFRKDVDSVQLYFSILSLSYIHLSNKYSLSVTYNQDLGDKEWLAARRTHVSEMILSYLCDVRTHFA